MAFFSKVGGIMRQTVSKQLDSHLLSPSSPSIFQALRWMSSSKVFIGGLSYNTDDTSLREAFSQYGTVVDARVIVDRESSRSRGFGFVTYTSSEEASSAIQALDGQELHGRSVRVAYATERSRSPGFGGGGYGGGGGGYAGGGGAYGGGGGNYGGGDAGGYGGNSGGGSGTGGYGGGSGTGGYGGSGSGNQGGVDGYGNSGGANYGGGSYGNGGNPGAYNAGGYGGASGGSYGNSAGSDATSYGGGANFDVSGGNVTSNTSFASSGFEEGSGLGGGSSDQFGITTATTGVEDGAGNFEPNEPLDRDERDDEEPDDFAKRA